MHKAFTPAIVDVTDGDHVPLARFEFELNAVLLLLTVRFGLVGQHETVAHEVGRVAEVLARAEPVQVGFLFLDVDATHRIDANPRGEREAVLVRPIANRRQRDSLFKTILDLINRI